MSDMVSNEQARDLVALARQTIHNRLAGGDPDLQPPEDSPFHKRAATFVTLKHHGQLRGCIGNLEPVGSIWDSVKQNAINAAFHDSRFSPLLEQELAEIRIDVSILSEPEILEYEDAADLEAALRPGIDGVVLRLGRRGATFLPQVWDQLPTVELFLGHLCQKAGLAANCWQTDHPEILTYQVQCCVEGETK